VAIRRVGVFRRRNRYFSLEGRELSEEQVESLKTKIEKSLTRTVVNLRSFGPGSVADANMRDKDGKTALMRSIEDIGRRLHIDTIDRYSSHLERMIKDGADVNMPDCDGKTALMGAVYNRDYYGDENTSMAEFLLKNGADVNVSDNDGRTALITAASLSYISFVKVLLQNGADANAKDKNGRIALDHAKDIPLNWANRDAVIELLSKHTK